MNMTVFFFRIPAMWGMLCILFAQAKAGEVNTVERQWPQFRHDRGLTGFSPLKGVLGKAPEVLWSVDLGGTSVVTEQVRVEDINGDEQDEVLRILSDRLICQDIYGKKLWEANDLPSPVIIEIRDFAGDGSRGLLVQADTGTEMRQYMISGKSGKKALLYATQNSFGGSGRIGHILPDVPGEQICSWWSGEGLKPSGTDKLGRGYLWSFEKGVENPVVRFQREDTGVIYAPLHLFADMDGDGQTDMLMVAHEQAWVYDLKTSEKKGYYQWLPTIRTYIADVGAVPLKRGELPSILIISHYIPGLEVITQNGRTGQRKWKKVIGPTEDQYQQKIKVDGGAPDPFMDLDGDGGIEMIASILNEHDDALEHLVIFRADDGERLFDQPNLSVLSVDDLDGDGVPEIILATKDGALRIANWNGHDFVDRWKEENVTPLIQPEPPEKNPARAIGGGHVTGKNMPLWREAKGASAFLLRFGQGAASEVWSCELKQKGDLEKLHKIEKHEALGNAATPPAKNYQWDGERLSVEKNGQRVVTYELPRQKRYQAPPALVGTLGGQTRMLAIDSKGTLLSFAQDGSDRRELLEKVGTQRNPYMLFSPLGTTASICDLDGDGKNEVLAMTVEDGGKDFRVVAVDETGKIKMEVKQPENTYEPEIGPTGSLGADKGLWFVVRYRLKFGTEEVVAYDGKTGEQMWVRDYYGPVREPATRFLLHIPTGVVDADDDGADDLLADSENDYGVISVKDNRDISPPMAITGAVPGHWGAYAVPIAVKPIKGEPTRVFFHHAFALTMLGRLDGTAIWHYGLTRDTTHYSYPGVGDLDGDGKLEFITSRKDGELTCYGSEILPEKCPGCPADHALQDSNHSGKIHWTYALKPPVSDFVTADLDGDGKTEVLCGAGDGKLYALKERNGKCSVLWSVDFGGGAVGAPIIADLDGKVSILVPTQDGRLVCLGHH